MIPDLLVIAAGITIAAAGGALVGSILHEMTHAIVAVAFGVLNGFGWEGGLAGGPYVEYNAETRWQSEAVRKAPLAVGIAALVGLILIYETLTLPWIAGAGATLMLLQGSPEDLFWDAADQGPIVANRRATRPKRPSQRLSQRRRSRLPAKRASARRSDGRQRP